jgi:hypothetical protein
MTVCADGQVAIPDVESEQVKVIVTIVLFQLFTFGAGEEVADTTGGVVSTLTVIVAVAVFPAMSVTIPVTA